MPQGWIDNIRLLRPKQWLKNTFVFAPLIFSDQFTHLAVIGQALFAFMLFCLAASITYIINDIFDIEYDRLHPIKSKARPLAAGVVSHLQAFGEMILLMVVLCVGFTIMPRLILPIMSYLILTILYSLWLKQIPVIDILVIAAGIVVRIWAGAVAISVPISIWMFVTTLFIAIYLAAIKRYKELELMGHDPASRSTLRYYRLTWLKWLIVSAAAGTIVCYTMFILVSSHRLALTIPFVLLGLWRYTYLAQTTPKGESPAEVLLGDPILMVTTLFWVILTVTILVSH